jgi:hypothetical protein
VFQGSCRLNKRKYTELKHTEKKKLKYLKKSMTTDFAFKHEKKRKIHF